MNIENVIDKLLETDMSVNGPEPGMRKARRTLTPSTAGMIRFQNNLAELKHELDKLSDWTDAEVKDEQLGKDLDALKQHLDNATGRASTVIDRLRRIKQ